jgi:hypothetical protein
VKEIRDVSKAELYKNDTEAFEKYDDIEEGFDYMVNHQCLTINHLQGITKHSRRVIVIINIKPHTVNFCYYFS